MTDVRQYILSITGAAILAGAGVLGTLVRMLSGIFLVVTMLAPVVSLELPDPAQWVADFTAQGQDFSAEGESMAEDAMGEIITDRVEAYIQDKAATYQTDMTVAVTVADGIPVSVRLTGDVTPDVKNRLSKMIEQELGISREAQQWE